MVKRQNANHYALNWPKVEVKQHLQAVSTVAAVKVCYVKYTSAPWWWLGTCRAIDKLPLAAGICCQVQLVKGVGSTSAFVTST